MTLLEGSRVCGASAVDADGAGLATDSRGFLVTAKNGAYGSRTLGWACQDGICSGGVDGARCAVSEVRVTCGGRTARASVAAPAETLNPRSTSFGFEPGATSGSFLLTAKLRKQDGTAVELCSHTQAYAAGETDETVFNRAANAINAGGPCQRAGVRAAIAGRAEAGDLEDQEPEPFRIQLEAPAQAGSQLITEVSASGAGFFTVHGFGTPERGRMTASRVAFSGTAAGGRVEVTEQSLLGSCTFAVETTAGESAEAVAERLQAAFLAPEAAGRPAFQFEAACLPGQNPRDAKRSGAALRFLLGSEISVNSTDAGLGYTIGSGQ